MVTTNSAAFKRMERRVVVLGLDVRADRSKNDLLRSTYAAATRARSLLVVVGDPDQLRHHELYTAAVAARVRIGTSSPPSKTRTPINAVRSLP